MDKVGYIVIEMFLYGLNSKEIVQAHWFLLRQWCKNIDSYFLRIGYNIYENNVCVYWVLTRVLWFSCMSIICWFVQLPRWHKWTKKLCGKGVGHENLVLLKRLLGLNLTKIKGVKKVVFFLKKIHWKCFRQIWHM